MLTVEDRDRNPTRTADSAETRLRRFRLATACLWTVLIMVLCWVPRTVVHEVEDGSSWFKIPHLDKVVHAGIFAVFAILWARWGGVRRRIVWVSAGGVFLAALTEIVQGLPIVGRDAGLNDGLADFAGIVVGLGIKRWVEPVGRFLEARIVNRSGVRKPMVRDSG